MNGRLLRIRDLNENQLRAWRDLSVMALEPNPLFEAECLVPAARHLPCGDEIFIVVAEEGGRFFGCFPIVRVAGNARPSATWRGVGRPAFTTQVRRLRYDGTPLLSTERTHEAVSAMFEALKGNDAGLLVLESVDADGPVFSHLQDAARTLGLPTCTARSWVRPALQRREERTYRDMHSGHTLREIARDARRLGRKLGGDVRLVDRSADPSAVDEVISLDGAGYKGQTGVALISHPGEPEWFREMCDRFRASGRLVIPSLQVGDTTVAMLLLVRGGGGQFMLFTVFDEDYRRYSPGIQLHLEAIDHFHDATDDDWINTCAGEGNSTLLRMYPDRRTVSSVILPVGGAVDRVALGLYSAAHRVLGGASPLGSRYPSVVRTLQLIDSKLPRWAGAVVHGGRDWGS